MTEGDAKRLYDAQIRLLSTEKEIKASHILVDNLDLVTELTAELASGSSFSELARLYSRDPTSSVLGGNLGYFV